MPRYSMNLADPELGRKVVDLDVYEGRDGHGTCNVRVSGLRGTAFRYPMDGHDPAYVAAIFKALGKNGWPLVANASI